MKRLLTMILMVIITMQNCTIFSIVPSNIRMEDPITISLSNDLSLASTGPIYVNFMNIEKGDFISAGIRIDYHQRIIYIDPIEVNQPEKADYILITHVHLDHFSEKEIRKLSTERTHLIGPKNIIKKFPDMKTTIVKPGDIVDFNLFQCETVHAYNIKNGFFKPVLHKKGNNFVGYVLTMGDNRIYHAGDTNFIPEMAALRDISVALVPIYDETTAMSPAQAAAAVNLIQPKIAIPIHYDLGTARVKQFKSEVGPEIEVRTLYKPE